MKRFRVLLAGLAAIMFALSAAAQTPCKQDSQLVQPGTTMCLDGFTNTCQPNGAWLSDRQYPCMAPVFPAAAKSCTINRNQSAAPGARACVNGKRRECGESGAWIDLGVKC